MTADALKPLLSPLQILKLNVGFLGLQFSFGLQQANMTPIYSYLGANEAELPILNLAGPMTGLLVQPIIGAMSDRTLSKYGRRTPYFLIGAVLCSLSLLAMPHSAALWMAASLLWIMDAANNVTMEPYRAYVSDRLRHEQQAQGFLTQSAFTSLAQFLAYLTPSVLVWFGMSETQADANGIPHITKFAFYVGAFLSVATIFYSMFSVRELPLTAEQRAHIQAQPKGIGPIFSEIWNATKEMPAVMRQLGWMSLFQWYGMMCYWIYVVPAVALSLFGTSDAKSLTYGTAKLSNDQNAAFYCAIGFFAALVMIPLAKRFGAKWLHAACLVAGGLGMLLLPGLAERWLMFIPMVGIGLAWGSIMGNPYIILARAIPPERTGVYMGIFNMFIVIPMLIQSLTFGWIYQHLLGGDARNALRFGGVLLVLAALAVLRVKQADHK